MQVTADCGTARKWLGLCIQGNQRPDMQANTKDAKTQLQEWLQARRKKLPEYKVVDTQGAAHQQTFEVHCLVPDMGLSARGQGTSRRAGEQAAAQALEPPVLRMPLSQ